MGSPSDFFTYILPRLVLSKFQVFGWCGNNDTSKYQKKRRGKPKAPPGGENGGAKGEKEKQYPKI